MTIRARISVYLDEDEAAELLEIIPCQESHEMAPDNRGRNIPAQKRAIEKLREAIENVFPDDT